MILITKSWNIPSIKIQHEFGHKAYHKMLVINCLFFCIFITKKNSKLSTFLSHYVNCVGVEQLPQYRQQIKEIKSKARKQAKEDFYNELQSVKADRDIYYNKWRECSSAIQDVKHLKRTLERISETEFDKLKNL